jgi:tRNA/rRNA methyltransferase
MISVVLIEPETSGNLGAIARIMANFDFKELILINPKCKIDEDARNRAKHAQTILDKAKIKEFDYLKKFDYKIATTAKLGTDYNIPRCPLSPEEFANKVCSLDKKTKLALIIGREGIGLTNEEIADCDFTVSIPVSKTYPTLNISHALTVILYELFKKSGEKNTDVITPISAIEKKQLMKLFNKVFDKLEFATPDKKETQKTLWKKIIGKAFLTKRESFAMMGFLKKLL